MSKRKRYQSDNSNNSSSCESHNQVESSSNEFIVKGLKTKLNDQPDEIMDHIFSFLASEEDDTVDSSMSMVSHKFRKAWTKTFSGMLYQCQSLMEQHVHRAPKKLKVLEQLKQSIDGMVNSVFHTRLNDLKQKKKEKRKKKKIAKLIAKCKENDEERTEKLMPILNRITLYKLKDADSYWNDRLMWLGAKFKLEFDNEHCYTLNVKEGDFSETEGCFSKKFWKKVKISKEDMLWLVQIAFDHSQLSYVSDYEITMDDFEL